MNVTIVLTDSELELVPEEYADKACSLPVLDAFYHEEAMKGLPERSRRGRPDIIHSSLLLCRSSPLFHDGELKVFVHTRHDEVIEVRPGTDVAPNYIKFLRDMGDLLNGKMVAGYVLSHRSLSQLVSDIGPDAVLALTPQGKDTPLPRYLRESVEKSLVIIIGGFPEGDYRSPVYETADATISLGPRLMRVPEVIEIVLCALPRTG